jgi:O-antigen ligase
MEQSLGEKWLSFLDEVIVWSIFAFIILLPLPHVTSLTSIAKILPIVAWIAKMVIQKRLLFKKNDLSWPILGYIGACLLSLIHSVDVIYSLDEIRGDVISPVLLYLVVVDTIQQKHLKTIFGGFLCSAAMLSSYGIWAFANGTKVLDGRALLTFHYPVTAGVYLSILIILTLSLAYIAESWWRKAGVITCLLISLIAVFLTQARGALAAGSIAFVIFAFLRDRKLLVVMLLGLMILFPLLPKNTVDRAKSIVDITSYTNENSSMHSRYGIWRVALLLLKDKWLWGVGYGWKNASSLLTAYSDKYKFKRPNPVIYHTHNIFLQEWLEIGLIGFVMFMWLVVSIFRQMWPVFRYGVKTSANSTYVSVTIAAIWGFFIADLVDFFLRYEMVYLFWIIVGLFMVLVGEESGPAVAGATGQGDNI